MMGFEESPPLDLYKEGLPDKLPDPRRRRMLVWAVILILLIASAVLGYLKLVNDGTIARLTGTGAVTGYVFDDTGAPVRAEVFVFRTNIAGQTNAEGYFELTGVPVGEQILVFAYRNIGRESTATVFKGQTTDLGQLHFQPEDFSNGWSQ